MTFSALFLKCDKSHEPPADKQLNCSASEALNAESQGVPVTT